MVKQKQFLSYILFCILSMIAFIVFATSPYSAQATHTCTVVPFSQKVIAGEKAQFRIMLKSDHSAQRIELKIGELPHGVGAVFGKTIDLPYNTKESDFVLTANPDSEIGSFSMAVVYHEDDGTGVKQAICPVNFIISAVASLPPAPSPVLSITRSAPDTISGFAPTSTVSTGKNVSRQSPISPEVLPFSGNTEQPKAKKMHAYIFTMRLARADDSKIVRILQETMQNLGFFPKTTTPTGFFGPITEQAVRAFQQSRRIEPVGIVGPKTRAALNSIK